MLLSESVSGMVLVQVSSAELYEDELWSLLERL